MRSTKLLSRVSLVCFALLTNGCGGNSSKPAEQTADLVSHFKGLADNIATKLAEAEHVSACNSQATDWDRTKIWVSDVKFDVVKTSSLVSPYTAELSFIYRYRYTKHVPTKQEAEKAELSENLDQIYKLSYALQGRKWVRTKVHITWMSGEESEMKDDSLEMLRLRIAESSYPAVVGKID